MITAVNVKSVTKDELIALAKADLDLAETMAERAYIVQDLKSFGEWQHDIGLAKGQLIILETKGLN